MANKKKDIPVEIYESIANRALYYSTQMIYQANNRKDKEKGDPKIGGHPSACASYLHIACALHLHLRKGSDCFAIKPHASPMDHSFHYMLNLFLESDFERFDLDKSKTAMMGLRKFSLEDEPVFQSYHSAYDSDHFNFVPSGTVGIPPVQLGYLAHAYRLAEDSGYEVPKKAHFWALMGDSEYREGSLQEVLPDFAERELGNLTWILDYNRQSLDGNRITNKEIMKGSDDTRVERTAKANGWKVIQVRHGKKREKLFDKTDGDKFKKFLEEDLEDFALQSLLVTKDIKKVKKEILKINKDLKNFIDDVSDKELEEGLRDLGGHDLEKLIEALEESKKDERVPCLVICHTIKGWGLECSAATGNHNALTDKEEIENLMKKHDIPEDDLFKEFEEDTKERKFLKERGDQLFKEIKEQNELKEKNKKHFQDLLEDRGGEPEGSFDVNLKIASYPHTQWMLGQISAKLNRIANTPLDEDELKEKQKPLKDEEKKWKMASEMLVTMAPDVGTTTNLNPTMDGQVYDPETTEDYEKDLDVKDKSMPDLVPSEEKNHRFLRFEIEEANVMSCMGAYGRIRDMLGIPLLPLMTIYDFFVKRALDQFFYNLYWKSSFIMVGTPSGITLSPEGAQHGWKSDFQIPGQIVWEPFYCQELDFIMADAIKRHITYDNDDRWGVHIRCATRGADQKELMKRLKRQSRFKEESDEVLHHKDYPLENGKDESDVSSISDSDILKSLKEDVLKGAYYLVDYRNYAGYVPGENVVYIFSMGSPTTEALKASDKLLETGIYANVIVVTSPDLLVGNLGYKEDYQHLKEGLEISGDLYISDKEIDESADFSTLSGRRVPIVSVHDGEPGFLDNIGSIIGVRHECLAVRRHSKCGRPEHVYTFHNIHADKIVESCGKVLSETAMENVKVRNSALKDSGESSNVDSWKELWPKNLQS